MKDVAGVRPQEWTVFQPLDVEPLMMMSMEAIGLVFLKHLHHFRSHLKGICLRTDESQMMIGPGILTEEVKN
jgi:hypothetical protein